MFLYRVFIFAISLFCVTSSIGQTSYIVQIEKGRSLLSTQRSSSNKLRMLKQICDEPINLWEVEVDGATEAEVIDLFYTQVDIVSLSLNRKISERAIPNDSLYKSQWQFKNDGTNSNGGVPGADINAEAAWDITTGGKTMAGHEIVVAVVDDGLNINHEDFQGNIWVNRKEIPNDNIDNDSNGYIDDVNGWDVFNKNGILTNDANHGTPVAGLIGAKGDNGIGMTGVNWNVKLMPIVYGNGTEAYALASYAYAYKMRKKFNQTNGADGAFIVATNASWGIDNAKASEAPLWCAFYDSLGAIGILNVAATTNSSTDVDVQGDLPTSCESEYLIAVTNINKSNQKVTSAGYGRRAIDIGAYGIGSMTTSLNGYGSFGGTSGASPQVCGAVALLFSVGCSDFQSMLLTKPSEAALYVKDLILNTRKDNPTITNITTTGGVLNVGAAAKELDKCFGSKMPRVMTHKSSDPYSFVVSWLGVPQSQMRYRKTTVSGWTMVAFTSGSSIANLDFCTEYEYQIRTIDGTDTSRWSYSRFINTAGCCDKPSFISYEKSDEYFKIINSTKEESKFIVENLNTFKIDTLISSDSIVIFDNLEKCNKYAFKVSRYCNLLMRYSEASDPIFLTTSCGDCTLAYCEPGLLSNSSEWIDQVTLGGNTYLSGKDANAFGKHMGTILPKVNTGDTFQISLTPKWKTVEYNENWFVYIDYNHNQSFDDDELVYSSPSPTKSVIDTSCIISSAAMSGITRLRVIMAYSPNQTGCDGSSKYGETEDYCIEINKEVSTPVLAQGAINLYPNPNKGVFSITNCRIGSELSIIDLYGKEVYTKRLDNDSVWVSLAQIKSGVYFVKIKKGSTITTQKMVVME